MVQFDKEEIKMHLYEYVDTHLTKRNSDFYNCPFCGSGTGKSDTGKKGTPAFKLYDDHVYCYSCEFKGDLISLYMKMNNISSFPQALQELAEEFHIAPLPDSANDKKKPHKVRQREHIYTDASGNPLAKKTIFKYSDGSKNAIWNLFDKDSNNFKQKSGLDGMKMPLYHNHKLHTSAETTIYFVEGEKDVETLENAYGMTATCTPNGAGATNWIDLYNTDLSGKDVIIVTDNDSAGEKYGNTVAKNLYKIAKSVKIVPSKSIWNDCPEKGDISDIIQNLGQSETRKLLDDAIATVPFYEPVAENDDNQSDNETAIPEYIIEKEDKYGNKYYVVHCPLLAMHIQQNEHYFYIQDSSFDGIRRYWYDTESGVYRLVSDEIMKSYIKTNITNYFPDILRMRDVSEVFQNVTTDHKRTVPETAVNSDENIINFRNGLLNLETMKLLPHSPDYKSTIQIDGEFVPETSEDMNELTTKAPVFMQYLNDLANGDEQRTTLFLEIIGACLSNVSGYHFKKVFALIGASNSGKSVFINLIRLLIGAENCASIEFSRLDERFQSSAMYGKRLAYDADANYNAVGSNSTFMKVSGGDAIQFEVKGKSPFSAVYHGFILLAANEYPRFKGNLSQAAYNRLLTIPCDNPIPEEKQDKRLLEKLADERNIIIQLALNAFAKTVRAGYRFTIPDVCNETAKDLKLNNDPVARFYEECCVNEPDVNPAYRKCSSIHAIYKEWYHTNISEHGKTTATEFYTRLVQHLNLSPKEADNFKCRHMKHGELYPFTLKDEIWNTYREGSITEKHTMKDE